MAKLTTLEIFNGVARNCGEEVVASLTALSGLQLVIWDKIIEAIQEVCGDQSTRWKFLESEGTVPLTTGNYKYQISALTYGADMQKEDKESFLAKDFGQRIKYATPQDFDKDYPYGVIDQGLPDRYMIYAGYINFNKKATATENGKNVTFRYWKQPTIIYTATPSANIDIPEPYDRLVIVALATMKVLMYLGNDEAVTYKMMVYGDGRDIKGNFAKLYELYGSPDLKARFSAIL